MTRSDGIIRVGILRKNKYRFRNIIRKKINIKNKKKYWFIQKLFASMSSAIACHMEGFELDICEMDKDYFDAAVNRFKIYEQQQKLF